MITISDKDKKILEDINKENASLLNSIMEMDPSSKKNPLLTKAILLRFLHIARLYKKLGGRFAKEFGPEINEGLKSIARAVETANDKLDPKLIDEAKTVSNRLSERLAEFFK